MKRISKTLRERAAVLCALAASNESETINGSSAPRAVQKLAFAAFMSIPDGFDDRYIYAEAEALLRTGWSPS